MNNPYIRIQIESTKALIKFIEDHDGNIDNDLISCLKSLEKEDSEKALNHAKMVKPHGMGGITDWLPKTINNTETSSYNEQVLLSLVNEWCRVIALSFKEKEVSRESQKGALMAPVKPNGIVFCVFCGKTFSSKDSVSWDGQRHKTCGIKLKLFPAESFDEHRGA